MTSIIAQDLLALGTRHKSIVLLDHCGALSSRRMDFVRALGDRYVESEASLTHLMAQAIGFSIAGKLPFVVFNTVNFESGFYDVLRFAPTPPNVKAIAIGSLPPNASFDFFDLNATVRDLVDYFGPQVVSA